MSTLSLASAVQLPNRLATLEVYELVYGRGGEGESPSETVERLYEANAGEFVNRVWAVMYASLAPSFPLSHLLKLSAY